MKAITAFSFFVVLTGNAVVHAQSEGSKAVERVEQLRKVRMIEILDLTEDQSVRFFARLHEHEKTRNGVTAERTSLLDRMERLVRNKVDPGQYRQPFAEMLSIDDRLFREEQRFFDGLSDVLSEEQRAKLLLFERQFQKELMDALIQIQKRRPG